MKTPDWDFWKDIEEVELWQAAFLANNVDPDTQRPPQRHYQPYNSRPRLPDGLHDEKVSKLLRKLIAKWQQGQFSSPPLVICSNSNFQRVNLSEVATRCIHMNYDIPQELAALAKGADTDTVGKDANKHSIPSVNTGITKREVIAAFEGLHFDTNAKWSRALANTPKWLGPCRVMKGSIKASALWNPVDIAVALFGKDVTLKKLDEVFIGLRKWTDEWQEKSDYLRK